MIDYGDEENANHAGHLVGYNSPARFSRESSGISVLPPPRRECVVRVDLPVSNQRSDPRSTCE